MDNEGGGEEGGKTWRNVPGQGREGEEEEEEEAILPQRYWCYLIAYPVNLPCQPTLSTHPINSPPLPPPLTSPPLPPIPPYRGSHDRTSRSGATPTSTPTSRQRVGGSGSKSTKASSSPTKSRAHGQGLVPGSGQDDDDHPSSSSIDLSRYTAVPLSLVPGTVRVALAPPTGASSPTAHHGKSNKQQQQRTVEVQGYVLEQESVLSAYLGTLLYPPIRINHMVPLYHLSCPPYHSLNLPTLSTLLLVNIYLPNPTLPLANNYPPYPHTTMYRRCRSPQENHLHRLVSPPRPPILLLVSYYIGILYHGRSSARRWWCWCWRCSFFVFFVPSEGPLSTHQHRYPRQQQ